MVWLDCRHFVRWSARERVNVAVETISEGGQGLAMGPSGAQHGPHTPLVTSRWMTAASEYPLFVSRSIVNEISQDIHSIRAGLGISDRKGSFLVFGCAMAGEATTGAVFVWKINGGQRPCIAGTFGQARICIALQCVLG